MAEALVSVVLQQLASITLEQIEEEVNLVVGVDQEVQNLIGHLQAVQGVLQDAEERQVKEANIKNWLYNLKDASYQINDVLDDWNTAILKHHMKKQEKEGENNDLVLAKRNKVRFSIPSFVKNILICFGQIGDGQIGDRIIMRHDIAKRIKEINERLTWIAILRNNYNFQSTVRGTEQVERSKTTSFVDVSTIIGREEEKNNILSMLKSESGHQLVIPIVGMGGLGKTAFAQSVYHDQNVTTHFHQRIWVCVSDPFEEIKIARAIIEVLKEGDTRKNSNEFQTLLECISDNIVGIKFLLVLDDVWNPTMWDPLKAALQKGDANSRILVTTRNNTVAVMMGATNDHMINLNKLSDRHCLDLFHRIAFFDKEKDESKLFDEDIKKKIAKKVDGLPLAAKTLASLMQYKKTRKEWVAVLESKMWELEEVEQQVFKSLLLSYYDLTPAVRQCLLFCAVFPKDYKFDRNELIECWMSQEYLSMKGDKEKERMIGQQYFDNLVMRSFFQDFVKDEVDDDIIGCKMHDIVHDFVQFLTKNECFIMEVVESGKEKNMVVDNKIRHLNIMSTYNDSFPVSIYNCKGLRTLVISTWKLPPLPSDSFSKLKSIRTLNLKKNTIEEVPESIGGLVHLRYLDLSGNHELEELPDSVGNLFNLETLRLIECEGLRELPVSLRKLVNLKHLYIEGCLKLELPKEIGRLRNLQILDFLYLQDGGGEDDEGIFKLGDLGNLEQLQESLLIGNLKSAKDGSEAKNAELVNKKNLLHLTLDFGHNFREREPDLKDEEILNGFQVHTNLESLTIIAYLSTTLCPSWMMSCHNLRRLEFYVVPFCGVLAPLGKLPSLEYLEMGWMKSVKKVGVEFLGITGETPQILINSFPKLKQLQLRHMWEWEDWEGVEEEDSKITIMPSLLKLEIIDCIKLKALPNFLWKTPLRELIIVGGDCPILAQWFETRCGMEWLKNASQVQNIKIQGKFVKKDGVGMLEED
ncbi:unnamed protein product [Prunus armeniaca]|uniref:NB-ARC domain-containing protein n=1 Tax=Prunus armeniaca TaxID=36596 RepID=A0A6J5TT82_PRUAR|nr:unnamed protein product [Prunus armeniaca]